MLARSRLSLLTVVTAVLLALLASVAVVAGDPTIAPAEAATTTRPILFGVSAVTKADLQRHQTQLGRKMGAYRIYKKWNATLFSGDQLWARDQGIIPVMTVSAQRLDGSKISWKAIANAAPGTALYNDMVRQAQQLKNYGGPVYFGFHHEPEEKESYAYGTGADFIAAWRKLVSIYRAQGVTNVRYTVVFSAWSYIRTDQYRVDNYYPGDAYVDVIAADGFNWYKCRTSTGRWTSLATVIEGHRKFGAAHPGKLLMLAEWNSVEDPADPYRKARWFDEARQLFAKPGYEQYVGLTAWTQQYYADKTCRMGYETSTISINGLRKMATDPLYSRYGF